MERVVNERQNVETEWRDRMERVVNERQNEETEWREGVLCSSFRH